MRLAIETLRRLAGDLRRAGGAAARYQAWQIRTRLAGGAVADRQLFAELQSLFREKKLPFAGEWSAAPLVVGES
jgi:hypothetical protein